MTTLDNGRSALSAERGTPFGFRLSAFGFRRQSP
jgi:hypothetical protein